MTPPPPPQGDQKVSKPAKLEFLISQAANKPTNGTASILRPCILVNGTFGRTNPFLDQKASTGRTGVHTYDLPTKYDD